MLLGSGGSTESETTLLLEVGSQLVGYNLANLLDYKYFLSFKNDCSLILVCKNHLRVHTY